MITTKTLFALAITGLLFTGCKEAAKAPDAVATESTSLTSEVATGKMETASFNIEGMTCAQGCAKTIEKKLSKMDGVQKASVDFEKKNATVEFDASKQTPEKLVETVEAAGDGKTYKVSNLKSSGDQAMNIDPEKPKKKRKSKKEKAADKKAACDMEAKAGAKPACCASKKSCSSEEKAGTL